MIAKLIMTNCGPFRGKHVVTFRPGAQAILARHEDDPRKSNRIGKSFILEMIAFAITGSFSKSRDYNADGWITEGEKEADVSVEFEDGAYVDRSKKRGQSTQIRFKTREMSGEAAQDAAAAKVLEHLALTDEDFYNAAYFEQRKMAKLVDPDQTKPAARLEIVSGWFGLGIAERGETVAGERAADLEKVLTRLTTRRDVVNTSIAEIKEVDIHALTKEVEKHGATMRALEVERKESKRIDDATEIVDEQAQRIKESLELREAIKKAGDVKVKAEAASAEMTKLSQEVLASAEEVRRKKKVALGLFDGACPVAPIECPVKDKINKDRKTSTSALTIAREAHAKAESAHALADVKYQPLFEKARAIERMNTNLARIREAVTENAPEVKESNAYLAKMPKSSLESLLQERMTETESALRSATVALGIATNDSITREHRRTEVAQLDHEIAKQQKLVSLHLRARALFRLAQRRVAERNLSFVEDEANYQLAEATIDLTVKARWEREAAGPAKTCEECGAAFPSSAKVKTCERCGTPRGQHMTQRLDFLLSDRSGAFNDLGGVTMQLAAGAWLLGARHSPWATAMLDEPFAQCDPYNRRALATQLLKLLNRGVWRQAIVISHSPDTIDIYPHKITIIESADGTRRIEQS